MGWMFGLPALIIALIAIIVTKVGWRWFYIAAITSKRDIIGVTAYIKVLLLIKRYEKKNLTISDIFEMNVAKHPDKLAIVSDSQSWSFRQLNEFSNRIGNLFHQHGYKKGDIVGLMLENRPEFVGIWLGLSKIGIITPLINTNLRGPSLLHSITVANCNAVIYGEAYSEAIESISNEIPSNVSMYQFNDEIHQPVRGTAKDLISLIKNIAKDNVPSSSERASHHEKLVFIYTSGTTGLPKAAVISHSRYLFIAAGIHYTLGFRNDDIFYTPLPLYHTAGGVMSMGQALIFGSTVAIRKKFSASSYFVDCSKFNCTIGQYIGEMCRYILATGESENDRKHKIRLLFGNGLRPQIWPQFVERFNIPKIGEFYGATEGNANIMNNDNTIGAIGFISRIIPSIYPISIIRADQDTGEPIRGADGLCQLCEPNEPGIFIGKIIKGNPSREFLGYVDEKASAKKIVRDVFKKGDMAFLSGDLLVADERGYLYFKDRTGDTFRWKGENVSTSEVEAQVSNVAGYKDTIVYGVTIPNTEGRAGMAAIYDPDRTVDLDIFSESLQKVLPSYAKPQFLRFLTKIDLTGMEYVTQYDPKKIAVINIKDLDGVKNAINIITPNGSKVFQSVTAAGKNEWIEKFEVAFRFKHIQKQPSKKGPAPLPPKVQKQISSTSVKSIESDTSPIDDKRSIVENWGPEWITSASEEIQTLIAQRQFEDALSLIKKSQDYISKDKTFWNALEILERVKLLELNLANVLLHELSNWHCRNLQAALRSARRPLKLLVSMGRDRQACSTLLQVCTMAIRTAQREARRTNNEISELFFCDLAQVACEFLTAFENHTASVSALVVWCNSELQYFASQLVKHYLTKGSQLSVVAKCVEGIRKPCSKLTEIGLDLSYHMEGLLRSTLEQIIEDSRTRLLETIGRSEDAWQPYNLQTKSHLKHFLTELNNLGLNLKSQTTGDTWINLTQATANFCRHYLTVAESCGYLAKSEALTHSLELLLRDVLLAQHAVKPNPDITVDLNFVLKNKKFLIEELLPIVIEKFQTISGRKSEILIQTYQQLRAPPIPKSRSVYQTDVF